MKIYRESAAGVTLTQRRQRRIRVAGSTRKGVGVLDLPQAVRLQAPEGVLRVHPNPAGREPSDELTKLRLCVVEVNETGASQLKATNGPEQQERLVRRRLGTPTPRLHPFNGGDRALYRFVHGASRERGLVDSDASPASVRVSSFPTRNVSPR